MQKLPFKLYLFGDIESQSHIVFDLTSGVAYGEMVTSAWSRFSVLPLAYKASLPGFAASERSRHILIEGTVVLITLQEPGI